ncbi:MAG: efflux RND transporter periplasmic adaptor subunit [Pseudomonadota bacterium]
MLDKVSPNPSLPSESAPETEAKLGTALTQTGSKALDAGGSSSNLTTQAGAARSVRLTEPPRRGGFVRGLLATFKGVFQAVLMVAILAGAYVATNRIIDSRPETRKRPPFTTVYTVDLATVALKDHQPVFVAYGQTAAARTVDLRSLVGGEIVKVSPKLRAGAAVKKGDALVEIDDFTYRGNLAEAKANLAEAEARIRENEAQIALERGKLAATQEQLELAKADVARAERLRQRNTVTQQQLESRKLVLSQRSQAVLQSQDTIRVQQARLAQLQASLERLKWGVQKAERNLTSTKLVAPFDGIIRTSTAEVGRNITANDAVVSMYEAGTLEVKFTLSDARFGRLQSTESGLVGRSVEIIWNVGGKEQVYPATIDRVGAEIMSNRGGVEVIARLNKNIGGAAIRPGAFVEVRVPDQVFENTAAIPDTAIYDGNTVYIANNGVIAQRAITVAAFDGEMAIIGSGLKDGERVLVTRITEVSDGLRVRTEAEAAAAAERQAARQQARAGSTTGRN